MSGTNSEVAGVLSATSSMKTENANRTVMPSVTFSPHSAFTSDLGPWTEVTRLGRQPEPDDAEQAQPETRADDVEEVVERASTHQHAERHVRVRMIAARVPHLVPLQPTASHQGRCHGVDWVDTSTPLFPEGISGIESLWSVL